MCLCVSGKVLLVLVVVGLVLVVLVVGGGVGSTACGKERKEDYGVNGNGGGAVKAK